MNYYLSDTAMKVLSKESVRRKIIRSSLLFENVTCVIILFFSTRSNEASSEKRWN